MWKLGITFCSLGAIAFGGSVTYREVQPLLAKHCTGCHTKGEIGPMPLTSFNEVRPWAKAIKEAVVRRTMPPWHADEETTPHFANRRSLSGEERALLVAWVDKGAKEGAPIAPARAHSGESGWRLGKPDLVVRVPGYKVPAQGTVEYTFLITPTSFPGDRWITATEWKIDKRTHVHHMNAYLRPKGSSYLGNAPVGELYVASKEARAARRENERDFERRELLSGYEPGYRPIPWGPQRAKLLARGTDIVFEIHYNTNGEAAVDYSELGIYFAKEPPRERVLTIMPADSKLEIPAGEGSYRSATSATLTSDVLLVSLQPHMHVRGKSYEIAATYPDGRKQTLLRVPKYDFRWQTTYFLNQPLPLPKGTVLNYTAFFDNSANNSSNPDPAQTVRWGDQSWQEMNIGFTEVAVKVSQDPEVAKLQDTTKPAPTATR